MTISYNIGTSVPIIQYDGASTVPDLTNSLNMMLGIGQQIKQQRDQKQAMELTGQLSGKTTNDFLASPESQKQFARLQQLDPEIAQYTAGLMQMRDEKQIATAAQEAEEAKNYFSAIYNMDDPVERRAIILERATQLKSEGKDYSKLMDMLNLTPEQQRVRALKYMLVAGDVSGLAKGGLEEQMKLQKMQMDLMSTQQQMQLREQEFALKQQDADRRAQESEAKRSAAETKVEAVKQKEEAAKNTAIAQTQFIDEQTKLAADQAAKAFEGRMGQVGAWISPTGDSANLRRTLDTIKANVGFGELMRMKRESPTGGALGSVSERELMLLNATMGDLDAIQSDEELLRVLNQVRDVFSRISKDSGGEGLEPLSMGGKPAKSGGGGQSGKRIKFGDLRQ